jgi:hypothetical protein
VSLFRFNETIDITDKTGKVSEETRKRGKTKRMEIRETVFIMILNDAAIACTVSRQMVTWLMTDEFERIWKEAAPV